MGKKVRVVSNWTASMQMHDRIIDQYVNDKTKIEIQFTNGDDYDYLIVFNDFAGFEAKVPRERILGFIQEPPDHAHFFDVNLGDKCAKVYTCADASVYSNNANFETFSCGMFYHMEHDVQDFFEPIPKSKKVSCVVSGLSHGFYRHRVAIARQLVRTGVDVWGRGLSFGKGFIQDKSQALLPYEFSVCMENGIWEGYHSDKIIDAVMCGCIPIYVGHESIKKHMPFAFVIDDLDPRRFVSRMQEIVNEVEYYDLLPKIDDWKFKFLKRYSILEKIKEFAR